MCHRGERENNKYALGGKGGVKGILKCLMKFAYMKRKLINKMKLKL